VHIEPLRFAPALPHADEHEQLAFRIVDEVRLIRSAFALPLAIAAPALKRLQSCALEAERPLPESARLP